MTKYVNAKTLSEILGVSYRHIYRMKDAGKIPQPIEIGKCLRWDLDEVLEALKKAPVEEETEEAGF